MEILGRRPTGAELAMYSVMWSEHCSYKSSQGAPAQFGEKAPQTDALLVGIGENAGVVDVGQGYAVTFKVESHNHPSYVEPYQGAATGVGGIVRDIIAMGARPVAVMDPLRFGAADHPDTKRVLPGVVAGIGGYGNCLGLPNIGGEVVFDACYQGNPLVNALCDRRDAARGHPPRQGVRRRQQGHPLRRPDRRRRHRRRLGPGLARPSTTPSPSKRPAVQVGDPFQEKLLIECTPGGLRREAGRRHPGPRRGRPVLRHLRAGLERLRRHARRAGRRTAARLHALARGDPHERVAGAHVRGRRAGARSTRFLEICEKWDVIATVIGEVTDGDRLEIFWHGEQIVDVDPRTVAHEGPVYERPYARPDWQDALQADDAAELPRPATAEELRAQVLAAGRLAEPGRPRRGSPTSTTASCRATPCWRSPRTPA